MRPNRYLLSTLAALTTLFPAQLSAAADTCNPAQILDQANPGVVTVFTSVSNSSGFLASDDGIIVTSMKTLRDGNEYLHVKFAKNKVVQAAVLVEDGQNDIAILRVNLKNLSDYKPLELCKTNEDGLLKNGQELVALSAAADTMHNDKSMMPDKVSKLQKHVIQLESHFPPQYSGGPLLNTDGQVVGVSVSESENADTSPSADKRTDAVPVSLVLQDIDKAKKEPAVSDLPPPDLLPDIPEVAFPLKAVLKEHPDLFKGRNQKQYNFSSGPFSVCVLTPPEGHNQVTQFEENSAKHKAKDKKSTKITLKRPKTYDGDSYYDKPVVTILVLPKPALTHNSFAFNFVASFAAGFATGVLGPAAIPLWFVPLVVHDKSSVKRNFVELTLSTADGKSVTKPIASGRVPFTRRSEDITGYHYGMLVDKCYMGIYTFDAHSFETDQPLKLLVSTEVTKKKPVSIEFPEKVKQLVVADFKPYWEYVAKLSTDGKAKM